MLEHGYNGMSFLALYPGWEYFHSLDGDGFIAFERHNQVALAVGDPVCPAGQESALIEAFRTFCAAEKLTPAFVAATPRVAESCQEGGWNTLKIGEEPIFDLDHYTPHGRSAKKMRSDAKRAARDGMTIEVVPAGERPSSGLAREIIEVQQAWQSTRKVSPLSFTLRLTPLTLVEQKLLIVARCDGRVEGFVSGIPVGARGGYYLEAMIRRPGARGGTCESLFLAAVAECRARGVRMVATGLSPLRNAGRQPAGHRLLGQWLQFTFSHLNLFYKFKPLEHFKAKFGPTGWEDAFLIYRPGKLPRVSVALLHAFTPGRWGPLTAAVSRFKTPTEMGQRQFSPGNIVGMLVSAALAVAYSLVALQHPFLFAPFDYAGHFVTFPFKEVGEEARAHLVVDSVLLIAGGGWYARRQRSD